MPTSDIDNDVVSEDIPTQSSEVGLLSEQHREALSQLESSVGILEGAFRELQALQDAEKETALALEQTLAEEKQILSSVDLSEAQAVRKLCEVRARKDLRVERLAEARKRIALHVDMLIYDIGEGLRAQFINFSNGLLILKTREVSELFHRLFPPDHGLPVSIEQLTRSSLPVVIRQRLVNWCSVTLPKEQNEHLQQLRILVPAWVKAIRELLQSEQRAYAAVEQPAAEVT